MNEKQIWDRLYSHIRNPYGVAGVMGNFQAESAMNPINLEDSKEGRLGMTDAQYTASVDNGSYGNFVHDSAGYGLFQATFWSIKEYLLNYARNHGLSIGDLNMQVDCFCQLLKDQYANVWGTLANAGSVRQASDAVLLKFERPANQSEGVQFYRAGLGERWFTIYSGTEPEVSIEADTAKTCDPATVVAVAVAELGYLEKASNAQLSDKTANAGHANFTKYAHDIDVNYPRFYNGAKNGYAWCDCFVDWCFITAYGYENALRLLCQPEGSCGAGCTFSLGYYRNKGQFHQSNPQPGDQIFFGNSTESTHTGIVERVENGTVYTIEGNTSDQVARRSYSLSDGSILGYGRPPYDSVTDETAPAAVADPVPAGPKEILVSVSIPLLKKGAVSNAVKNAQALLIHHGYTCGGRIIAGYENPDGEFGPATVKAVKDFQALRKLEADGEIGTDTWTALLTT